MSYYDNCDSQVNGSSVGFEDGPELYPAWGAVERAHRYSHSYNADQWWAGRKVPRRPWLLKSERAAWEKKHFGGAIPGGQDAPMREPTKKATYFDAAPKAVEKPRPEGCPHEAGSRMEHIDLETGEVTRLCAACGAELEPALVVSVPKEPSELDYFGGLPGDGDPDGGVFEAAAQPEPELPESVRLHREAAKELAADASIGYGEAVRKALGGEPAANPLAGIEWTPPDGGGGNDEAYDHYKPPQFDLVVRLDPTGDRYVCEQSGAVDRGVHDLAPTLAVAGMVAELGGLAPGRCARVHDAEAGDVYRWMPERGAFDHESDFCLAVERLEAAARAGDIGGVREALASMEAANGRASDFQCQLDGALVQAAKSGAGLACAYLIDQGANPADHASMPLAFAATRGHAEAAELLLERGAREADLRKGGREALEKLVPPDPAPRYPGMALPGKLLWVAALLEKLKGEAEAVSALGASFDVRPLEPGADMGKGWRVAWAHPSAASPEARKRGERFDLCVNGSRPPRLVVGRGRRIDAWELRERKEAAQ